MLRRRLVLGALSAPWAATAFEARAEAWPTRPIRLVTPSPPGGAGDVSNRMVAKYMASELGQAVVVDNKVGGNGVIAAMEALRGGHDGYTVYVGSTTTLAANAYLMKNMPYEPATDFQPVSLIGVLPFLLVANAQLPFTDVKGLVAYAKAHPGVNFASANASSQVMMSMFARMAGLNLVNVPYKSAPASLNDVVSGQVQISFVDIPSALGLVQAGRLRLLGVSTAKRISILPETPTIAESGVPDFELVGWTAMTVPAGTDAAVVRRLNEAARAAIARPDVREQLGKLGFEAQSSTPEELGSFMRAERPRWARLIRAAGIEPE